MSEYRADEIVTVREREWKILRLLGKGKGGYSYLAQSGDNRAVLKQIHHEPCEYYQFEDKMAAEIRDYHRLKDLGIAMPEMLDADPGNERLIKEYIEGETVYELVLKDALPESCLQQVKEMCRILYDAGLNIDYFPTNFILREEKRNAQADFSELYSGKQNTVASSHKLYYVDYDGSSTEGEKGFYAIYKNRRGKQRFCGELRHAGCGSGQTRREKDTAG